MGTPALDWLHEVRVCRAIYRGILTHAHAPEWYVEAASEEVYFAAAMYFAHRLRRSKTRGGQKALAEALKEVRTHCIEHAMRNVGPGTPPPTVEQIAEYEAVGRAENAAAAKVVESLFATVAAPTEGSA